MASNNNGQNSITPPGDPKSTEEDSNNAREESKKFHQEPANAGEAANYAGEASNNDAQEQHQEAIAPNADDDGPPTSFYTLGDKNKRRHTFSCPVCIEDATGAHQCGGCYKHMHAICGNACPGSCEGHGQKRICHDCVEKTTSECSSSAASSTTKRVRVGDDHSHVGIRMPASAAEAHRSETEYMLGLLDSLQKVKQHQNLPLQHQPVPPPLQKLPLQLGDPFASTNVGSATGTSEDSGSEENSAESDNDGSEDSEERRRKKRITPDAKYEF
jgi:hypothetical protein